MRLCIPPCLGASYTEIQPGSSIHQESKHHWVGSRGEEGAPQSSDPTSQAASVFHMWIWLGWMETSLLRALPKKAEVPFKQSKGKPSLRCPLPVRALGSQMLHAGSQHRYCTQCLCSPHQDHPTGGCPQGGWQHLLLWKVGQTVP